MSMEVLLVWVQYKIFFKERNVCIKQNSSLHHGARCEALAQAQAYFVTLGASSELLQLDIALFLKSFRR